MPRRPGGAMFATIASDAGAQSISPRTTVRSTATTTGSAALTSSARYGRPMSRTPAASLTPREVGDVQRVIRSCSATMTTGFIAKSRPQVAGATPWLCVRETGASSSKAAYVHQPPIVATKTASSAPSRRSGRSASDPAPATARRASSGSFSAATSARTYAATIPAKSGSQRQATSAAPPSGPRVAPAFRTTRKAPYASSRPSSPIRSASSARWAVPRTGWMNPMTTRTPNAARRGSGGTSSSAGVTIWATDAPPITGREPSACQAARDGGQAGARIGEPDVRRRGVELGQRPDREEGEEGELPERAEADRCEERPQDRVDVAAEQSAEAGHGRTLPVRAYAR